MQLPLFAQQFDWQVPEIELSQPYIDSLNQLNVPKLTAKILAARGFGDRQQVSMYLQPNRSMLRDAFALTDMERTVERLMRAIQRREPIRICGDYDVDGVSATALLWLGLTELGADVDYWLPHRIHDGYGLSAKVVEEAVSNGRTLLITVDNGISAFEAAEKAKELGIDLLITDHHTQTSKSLPPAYAIINPNRSDCHYPFSGLSGSAIAWKVVDGLYQRNGLERPWQLLSYACLGIIADVAPLIDENRIMVYEGLNWLNEQPLPGIDALYRQASLNHEQVDTRTVSFVLAPRLNSAGRIGSAELAPELLICQDADRADRLAADLEQENQSRRMIGEKVFNEASIQVTAGIESPYTNSVITLNDRWHLGVLGIVASRLADQWKKPVLLAGIEDEEGVWLRGSARSANGIDITHVLSTCSEWLEHYGGHPGAAGFRLRSEQWTAFCEAIEYAASSLEVKLENSRFMPADCHAHPDEITPEFVDSLISMEPFGEANEEPVIYLEGLSVVEARRVGKEERHLRLRLHGGWTAIAFDQGDYQEIAAGRKVDLLATPRWNEWQGTRSIQLIVHAIRPHSSSYVDLWHSWVKDTLKEVLMINPDRTMLASVYRALRTIQNEGTTVLPRIDELSRLLRELGLKTNPSALENGLQIFFELGLVVPMQRAGEDCWVLAIEPETKLDLEDSEMYRKCQAIRRQWHEFAGWCIEQNDASSIQQRAINMIK